MDCAVAAVPRNAYGGMHDMYMYCLSVAVFAVGCAAVIWTVLLCMLHKRRLADMSVAINVHKLSQSAIADVKCHLPCVASWFNTALQSKCPRTAFPHTATLVIS